MYFRSLTVAALGLALLAGGAQAQPKSEPAAPAIPNLDAVPPQMPFNVPYGPPITLEQARKVIAGAEAEMKKRGWPEMCAVLDSGANLVAFEREDGGQLASIAIAIHKAKFAVTYRRESLLAENAVQKFHWNYFLSLDGVIASRGGIPLIENGKLIGAVGCSGGTGSQDEVLAKAGVAALNKK